MIPRLLLCAALGIGAAGEAWAQSRSGTGVITIGIPSSADSAHVEARYVLPSTSSALDLRVLTRPCITIENVRIERDGAALGVTQARNGPWITYHPEALSGDTTRLVVRYEVMGSGTIPLIHPATALSRADVTVRFGDDAQSISFPHMTRQAPGEWSARYVAVPSFVRIAGLGVPSCDVGVARGDNGGLVWRFFLLVGIMAAWVPLYLAWARRSGDSA